MSKNGEFYLSPGSVKGLLESGYSFVCPGHGLSNCICDSGQIKIWTDDYLRENFEQARLNFEVRFVTEDGVKKYNGDKIGWYMDNFDRIGHSNAAIGPNTIMKGYKHFPTKEAAIEYREVKLDKFEIGWYQLIDPTIVEIFIFFKTVGENEGFINSKFHKTIKTTQRKLWKKVQDDNVNSHLTNILLTARELNEIADTKIWIGDNPRLSRLVQKKAFELGWKWNGGGVEVQFEFGTALTFWEDKTITICGSTNRDEFLAKDRRREITPQDLGIEEWKYEVRMLTENGEPLFFGDRFYFINNLGNASSIVGFISKQFKAAKGYQYFKSLEDLRKYCFDKEVDVLKEKYNQWED